MYFSLQSPEPKLIVLCFCARWCNTCNEYNLVMIKARQSWTQLHFGWVDIEDHAELLGDLDLITLPSILIYQANQEFKPIKQLFFGPILPQFDNLTRLIKNYLTNTDRPQPFCSDLADLYELIANNGLNQFKLNNSN